MKKYNRTRSYFDIWGENRENLKKVLLWVRDVRKSDDYENYTEEEQDIFITIEQGIEELFDHMEWDEE